MHVMIVRSPSMRACNNPENHPPVELFLPYWPVQYGKIAVWDPLVRAVEEASIDYYQETIRPWGYTQGTERLIHSFKVWIDLNSTEPVQLVERIRLPNDWKQRAWLRP